MRISVQEASLRTVAVEIKALTVGGKQVTLAVFRQLAEEELLDAAGRLQGTPWGTVNYHPTADNCFELSDGRAHCHVVWQKGDELRRTVVYAPYAHHGEYRRIAAATSWVELAVASGWRPAPGTIRAGYLYVRRKQGPGTVVIDLPRDVMDILINADNTYLEKYIAHRVDQLRDRVNEAWGDRPVEPEDLWANVEDDARDFDEQRAPFVARWAEIEALPQLFIAV